MKKLSILFYEDAKRYYKAATVLSGNEQIDEDDQLFFTPILFLIRHSIELIIKAKIFQFLENSFLKDLLNSKITLENGQELKKKIIESHSLQTLFSCLRFYDINHRLTSIFDDHDLKFAWATIKNFESLDSQSDYFRYPVNKKNHQHKRKFICLSNDDVAYNTQKGYFLFLLNSPNKKVLHFSTSEDKFLKLLNNMMRLSYTLLNKF